MSPYSLVFFLIALIAPHPCLTRNEGFFLLFTIKEYALYIVAVEGVFVNTQEKPAFSFFSLFGPGWYHLDCVIHFFDGV